MAEADNKDIVLPTGTEKIVDDHKTPQWVVDLREKQKEDRNEIKALKAELATSNAKTMFGDNWKEGEQMLSAGIPEERIRELLNGSKESDPLVDVNDKDLDITKATGKQPKPELTEEEKKMEQEKKDHDNDLVDIAKYNQ